MFIDFGSFVGAALAARESAIREKVRWDSLTPEQQDRELRKREVEAIERQARALENPRRDVHHHFFS